MKHIASSELEGHVPLMVITSSSTVTPAAAARLCEVTARTMMRLRPFASILSMKLMPGRVLRCVPSRRMTAVRNGGDLHEGAAAGRVAAGRAWPVGG